MRAQQRETGDLEPKPIPGRSARKGDALRADLWSQLEANRDSTRQIWGATHGQQVSAAMMGRAIKSLGWTRKKDGGDRRARCEGASREGCVQTRQE